MISSNVWAGLFTCAAGGRAASCRPVSPALPTKGRVHRGEDKATYWTFFRRCASQRRRTINIWIVPRGRPHAARFPLTRTSMCFSTFLSNLGGDASQSLCSHIRPNEPGSPPPPRTSPATVKLTQMKIAFPFRNPSISTDNKSLEICTSEILE